MNRNVYSCVAAALAIAVVAGAAAKASVVTSAAGVEGTTFSAVRDFCQGRNNCGDSRSLFVQPGQPSATVQSSCDNPEIGSASGSLTGSASRVVSGPEHTLTGTASANGSAVGDNSDDVCPFGEAESNTFGVIGMFFQIDDEPANLSISIAHNGARVLRVTLQDRDTAQMIGELCPTCDPPLNSLPTVGVLQPGRYDLRGFIRGTSIQGVTSDPVGDPEFPSPFTCSLGITVSLGGDRRPVLIIPGVGATYPADIDDIGPWMFTRGIHPTGLQIDPLAHAYDDLIKTLENVGYVKGKDLFVVNYDWRVPPGPSDGVFDGVVGGLTAASITDQSFDYAVDYLGYYLRKAMDAWETDHPGTTLDQVNLIAHSTGGLVARTYIQSAAYGGTFDGIRTLPVVDNLMMIGVPNRGASKAWNPLHDNWGVDIAFQLVLSKILNMGYQKVLGGAIITGPDLDISLDSLIPPACQDLPEICFIQQFNPTTRSLLATYDFIDFGNGFTNVNGNPFVRNDLVLDLNAGLDLALNGDPNAFAGKATVTVIYATNVDTPTSVVEKVGPVGGTNAIVPFSDFGARNAQPGEVWYDDIMAPVSGDGTVPLDSSAGQFVGDARVTLKPFAKGTNTSEDVSHLGLMYNLDVQKDILGILGASFVDTDISTTLHSAIASSMSTALNVVPNIIGGSILGAILDPVEGFVVDGQGRRLGYSALTGPITEIPGSIWFGNSDGMGWVFEPLVGPVELQLSGLGGSYYVLASVISPGGSSGLIDQGVLEAGASRILPVPLIRNLRDLAVFQSCFGDSPAAGLCLAFDIDGNHSIDLQDFSAFLAAMTGP